MVWAIWLQDGRHSRVPGGRYQARLRGGPGVPGWCRLGRDEDAAPAGRLSAAAPVRGCRSGGGLPATEGAGDNLGLFSVLYWCRYFLRLFIEDRELAARMICCVGGGAWLVSAISAQVPVRRRARLRMRRAGP